MAKRRRKIDTNEYVGTISGLSHEGRGITHHEDRTVFVFNALLDETVKFKYYNKRANIGEANSCEIVTPSPKRIDAKCPAFTLCGGCSLQHMTPQYQREFKQQSVLELLEHQTITPQTLLPTLTASDWGYRRKARIGVKYITKKDSVMVGFRERNNSLIANINECHVLDERIGFKINELKSFIHSLNARQVIPQLEIAMTDDRCAMIIRHLEPLDSDDIEAIKQFAALHQFDIFLQPKGIDTITLLVGESEELSYTLPEFNLTFKFLPYQFTQVNDSINRLMVSQAIKLLELNDQDHVLDLFCGIGNFTLAAATKAKQVVGVEADKTAIAQAKKNAELNKLSNTEFHVGNLFEDCHELSWAKAHYDKILLDPPRSGAESILQLIPKWNPSTIVYVSCNPTTFARDAAILKQQGYILTQFGTMDMFPHTQHTEVMGQFKKDV